MSKLDLSSSFSTSQDGLKFENLTFTQIEHRFTLRQPQEIEKTLDPLPLLKKLDFPCDSWAQAEQPHSNQVGLVTRSQTNFIVPQVDALITNEKNITLIIRVADCGPLYLFDPVKQAIGVVHSGKKGTALNILKETVQAMTNHFGSSPQDLIVQLGPCIRPPHYEIDFAQTIREQAQELDIARFYDCGLNTGSDLQRFYSYRMEKGKTGRHYAALALKG